MKPSDATLAHLSISTEMHCYATTWSPLTKVR